MNEVEYIEIPTWPKYNNLNRVYLGGGVLANLDDPMRSLETATHPRGGHR